MKEGCSTSISRRVYATLAERTKDRENLGAGISGSSEEAPIPVYAPKATFQERSGSHL
jgi:hypothetical protein